jgi:hypothetical protein
MVLGVILPAAVAGCCSAGIGASPKVAGLIMFFVCSITDRHPCATLFVKLIAGAVGACRQVVDWRRSSGGPLVGGGVGRMGRLRGAKRAMR